MFAIIRTGGKQYKVQTDQVITIERLPANVGDVLDFDTVLMLGEAAKTQVGNPFIQGALVKGVVLDQDRSDKIIVFKKRRRHNYRRKQGHRQNQTVLGIIEISGPNGVKAQGKRDFNAKIEKKASDAKPIAKKEVASAAPKGAAPKKAAQETAAPKAAPAKSSEKSAAKAAPKKAPSKAK